MLAWELRWNLPATVLLLLRPSRKNHDKNMARIAYKGTFPFSFPLQLEVERSIVTAGFFVLLVISTGIFTGFVNRAELNHTVALRAREEGSNVGEEQLGSWGGCSSAQTGYRRQGLSVI